MRFAVDTGGTFTDLVIEDSSETLHMFKASTTPSDPLQGVLDALQLAADKFDMPLPQLLGRGRTFIYGTTHPINAIITGRTARTGFLTTAGHPDVLVLREGGRSEPFNFTVPFPEPYIPRSLTWEIPGRILSDGRELTAFDEVAVLRVIDEMKAAAVEAVAVCLLWSVVNPTHENRVGELIEAHMPGVPFTLSHVLNPTLREYRRASSAAIDASLKPMMRDYIAGLSRRLRDAGFLGRTLVVTSQGGVIDAAEVAEAPIHLINSGPSMAPVSGRYFADVDESADTVIVADTGGTTYDVSLVRRGQIPSTRETWIGLPYRGHMTGFPSVDVKSVGAGGGSIAWIDDGGMLHVGPQSAGSQPGPACYGRGGNAPTVTDASMVLGYIDPAFFLGGSMKLDQRASWEAVKSRLAEPLRLTVEEAAAAVLSVATENMAQAIVDITVTQGIDPRKSVLVGGGGAAGLNSVLIARRLEAPRLLIPQVGAALSAAGAMMSDLTAQYRAHLFTRSNDFDFDGVNRVLDELEAKAFNFIKSSGQGSREHQLLFKVEARYAEQVWEVEVALPTDRLNSPADLEKLIEAFHMAHQEVFAIRDEGARLEFVSWSVFVACRIRGSSGFMLNSSNPATALQGYRTAYFPGEGACETPVYRFEGLTAGDIVAGPAIIESSFTTIVLNPGSSAQRRLSGSLSIDPRSN